MEKFGEITGLRTESLDDWKEVRDLLQSEVNEGRITLEKVQEMYDNDCEPYNINFPEIEEAKCIKDLMKLIESMGSVIRNLDENCVVTEYWLNDESYIKALEEIKEKYNL